MWSLFLLQTPVDMGATGRGMLCELSHATSRSLEATLNDADTLTFEIPGESWQAALIKTGQTDVILFHDDYAVQKFRVTGRSISGDENGSLQVSVTCSAYRMLLGKLIFHEADTKSWATATRQDTIAWSIIDTATHRNGEDEWHLSNGLTCATSKLRTRKGVNSAGYPVDYYVAGDVILDAIEELAEMEDGFEWCIEPDRSSTIDMFRDLKFNAWDEGARLTHTGEDYGFVLDYGGAVSTFNLDEDLADFANVIRQTGIEETSEYNSGVGTAIWRPSTKNPTSLAGFGRLEKNVDPSKSQTDGTTEVELVAEANAALARSLDSRATIDLTLTPGRWPGPQDLWVGDYARVIINEAVFPDWVPNVMRVTEMSIDINDDGGEQVSLVVGRPLDDWFTEQKTLYRRVRQLNRR